MLKRVLKFQVDIVSQKLSVRMQNFGTHWDHSKHDLKPLALFPHLYFAVAVATHKVPYAQKITNYDIGGKLCKLCMLPAPLILGEEGGGGGLKI